MKNIVFGLFLSMIVLGLFAFKFVAPDSDTPNAEVNWYTWEEAVAANAVHKKRVYVDIYTDWCGPCKFMDRTTFKDPQVVNYLNEHFYPVKFNAERKEPLTYDGITHIYMPYQKTGYHQFAAALMDGKLSYPTNVFLTEDLVIEQRLSGTLNPIKMHKVLTYIVEESTKPNPLSWKEYQEQYDLRYLQEKAQKSGSN